MNIFLSAISLAKRKQQPKCFITFSFLTLSVFNLHCAPICCFNGLLAISDFWKFSIEKNERRGERDKENNQSNSIIKLSNTFEKFLRCIVLGIEL